MAAAVASPTSSTASVAVDTPASADSMPAATPIPKLVVVTAPSNNGMSATFRPEELVDFYDDPNQAMLSPAEWKEPENVRDNVTDVELDQVDWRQYEPPELMNKVANVTSEILLEIIHSSVANIKARNEEARQVEADQQQAEEETANEEARRSTENEEPYLPIIMEQETTKRDVETGKGKGKRIEPDEQFVAQDPTMVDSSKGVSKKRFALRKLFQKGEPQLETRAESSSAGAHREAMRQYFEHRLSKVNQDSSHSGAQATLAILRRNKSVKVPEAQELVECVSCLDDIPIGDTIKVPCHSYCKDCFSRLISAACQNEQQWPPKCCLNEIPFRVITKNISDDLKPVFQERQSEWTIPISERVYCHQPECAQWIQPKKIDLSRRVGRCDQKHSTCTICRGAAHSSSDCPQDPDLNMTNRLAEDEGWKRCGRCQALVEHREACQHMTCRCGYEFCYVCNRRWRTCSCTMQQLDALKQDVATRRNQRLRREQAEAEELENILNQIQEFERKEEERAEEERQEQLRLQEIRWQQIVKKRIRLETLRRELVQQKFQDLRQQLEGLHAIQQVLVDTQQEKEIKINVVQGEEKTAKLEEEHKATREQIKAKIETRIIDQEASLKKDYALRVAAEQKIEHAYEQQLIEYWADEPEAEEEVRKGMLPLRQRMDEGHKQWQAWKDEELQTYRSRLEEENAVREELMYSAKHRLRAQCEQADAQLAKRLAAERQWVQEILVERDRLLEEAEANEIEGDADSLFNPDNEELIADALATSENESESEEGEEMTPATKKALGVAL